MVAKRFELWFNRRMLKSRAIELLGGTITSAAARIGCTYQAVDKWPETLPPRIEDRVIAALAREHLSPDLLGIDVASSSEKAAA